MWHMEEIQVVSMQENFLIVLSQGKVALDFTELKQHIGVGMVLP